MRTILLLCALGLLLSCTASQRRVVAFLTQNAARLLCEREHEKTKSACDLRETIDPYVDKVLAAAEEIDRPESSEGKEDTSGCVDACERTVELECGNDLKACVAECRNLVDSDVVDIDTACVAMVSDCDGVAACME